MLAGQAHGLHLRGEGDEEWQSLPLHLRESVQAHGNSGVVRAKFPPSPWYVF